MGDIAWLRPAWLCVSIERRLSVPCRLCSFGLTELFLPRGTEGSNLASSAGESFLWSLSGRSRAGEFERKPSSLSRGTEGSSSHFAIAGTARATPVGCAVVWSCGGSAAAGNRFEQLAAVASPRRIPLLAPCPVSAAILGSAADLVDGRVRPVRQQ